MPMGAGLFDSPSFKAIQQTGGSEARPLNRILHHWPEALFDLENDPCELKNLIDDPALQPLVREYRDQLTRLRLETDDPWLEIEHQEGTVTGFRS